MKRRRGVTVGRAGAAAALLTAALACGGAAQRDPAPTAATPSTTTPTGSVVEETLPWEFEGHAGQIVRTKHYTIYTTESAPVIAGRLPGFAEASLARYTTTIGKLRPPTGRMETYLMGDRAQWQSLTAREMGGRAKDLLKIDRGGFAIGGKAYLFDIGAVDTMSITAHEGWHQFTQRSFAEPLPIWLEEGIATFMEGHKWTPKGWVFSGWMNGERFDGLRSAWEKKELLSLDDLLGSSPDAMLGWNSQGAVMYYCQVWALVHFLREGEGGKYRPSLERLVKDAQDGKLSTFVTQQFGERAGASLLGKRLGPTIFRAYFERDMAKASSQYSAFIKKAVGPGAKQKVIEGKSPMEK